LPPDDVLLLSGKSNNLDIAEFDANLVQKFIEEKSREAQKERDKSNIKWLSNATNTFVTVAFNLQQLLNPLVPQIPQVTLPYGCLMVIFKVIRSNPGKKTLS
jgi:hypothetical protein